MAPKPTPNPTLILTLNLRKSDRQITHRLKVDAIFNFIRYWPADGGAPVACSPVTCHVPAIHSDCRYAIVGIR